MLTSSLSRNIPTTAARVLCLLAPYFGCASPLDVSKGGKCFTFLVEKMVFCSKLLETIVNIFEWISFLLNSSREMQELGYAGLGFLQCDGTRGQERS